MSGWLESAVFPASLEKEARALLDGIRPVQMRRGTVLFRPGDRPHAFIVVLSGRVGVYLTGRTGREMLLYSVTPGETCVQTTLGMFADAAYTSEAIAESDLVITMVPKSVFEKLLAGSAAFRAFVFKALAARLKEMMNLLEQVAFIGIEERLARALLDRCVDGEAVLATHHELAIIIGSAREVVSRRLEALAAKGIVANERGRVRILSRQDLLRLAQGGGEGLVT